VNQLTVFYDVLMCNILILTPTYNNRWYSTAFNLSIRTSPWW